MLSKSQLKYYSSLKQKKYRSLYKAFIAEGDKMVNDLISNPGNLYKLKSLLALPDFLNREISSNTHFEIIEINEKELKRISSLSSPNRAILEIEIPEYHWKQEDIQNEFSFFFENIQDPGNLGTIIRTADWFGISNIFLSRESADLYNPKVIQSTMGSFTRVRVHYIDAEKIFEETNRFPSNYNTIATVLDGENIYETETGKCGMIFFGNESRGLSEQISSRANQKLCIPGHPLKSGAESLNLSIATGIIASEINRRKLTQNEN